MWRSSSRHVFGAVPRCREGWRACDSRAPSLSGARGDLLGQIPHWSVGETAIAEPLARLGVRVFIGVGREAGLSEVCFPPVSRARHSVCNRSAVGSLVQLSSQLTGDGDWCLDPVGLSLSGLPDIGLQQLELSSSKGEMSVVPNAHASPAHVRGSPPMCPHQISLFIFTGSDLGSLSFFLLFQYFDFISKHQTARAAASTIEKLSMIKNLKEIIQLNSTLFHDDDNSKRFHLMKGKSAKLKFMKSHQIKQKQNCCR